jgi:hypothetical protein
VSSGYTDDQQRVYDDTFAQQVKLGFSESAAAYSARGKAEGWKPPPPSYAKKSIAFTGDDLDVPRGICGLELLERDMPAISYNADPWIPEGLGITAGRPKAGKSTFVRQKLAAVAGGTDLFGSRCSGARCAFLTLEENDRQTRHKLELAGFAHEALVRILFFFDWPRGADGALQLARLLDRDDDIKYVAIDSLTRFRAVPDARTPAFTADYEAVTALQKICKARPGLTIEVVHHTRKMKSEDPLEDISGTFGLSAGVDWYNVLRPHEDGAVLHVGGRLWDRDVSQFQLRRANQRWELVGDYLGISDIQAATLAALRDSGGMTPTQGAQRLGISRQSAMERFVRLVTTDHAYSKAGTYFAK